MTAAERMAKARKAQQAWATVPVPVRTAHLRRLRSVIAARIDQIVKVISEEVGKPPLDALAGDVLVVLEQMRFNERHAREVLSGRFLKESALLFAKTEFEEFREAYGVVLVFAPWNYPLQLALVPTVTALLAGNAVLLKCSEHTPKVAGLISEFCRIADIPDGLVQVSCEEPDGAAQLLEATPDFVFFTGASANGRHIAQRCGALLIPSAMELGGKDAALVFASCNFERTLSGVLYGAFSNAGQVCVGIKGLYVERQIYDRFVEGLATHMHSLRIGADLDADIGALHASARPRFESQLQDAEMRGARLYRKDNDDPFSPVVVTGLSADARLLTEESFGPVVCAFAFEDEAHGVQLANASAFALSASIWTGDTSQGQRVAKALHGGSCAINDVIRNIGSPASAFGGNGASGFGRYHGLEGLRTFSRSKVVMTQTHPRKTLRHWFPFQAETYRQLSALLAFRHQKDPLFKRLTRLSKILLLFIAVVTTCGTQLSAAEPKAATLRMDILLPSDAHGQIAYLVFNSPKGFPGKADDAARHGYAVLSASHRSRQSIELGMLPPGDYAVSVFLDENENGKLDHDVIGIPKEPVGASNNPKERIGPPRFEDCVFRHDLQPQTIVIRLIEP